jgi:hypothetical protein
MRLAYLLEPSLKSLVTIVNDRKARLGTIKEVSLT